MIYYYISYNQLKIDFTSKKKKKKNLKTDLALLILVIFRTKHNRWLVCDLITCLLCGKNVAKFVLCDN